jgi:hypothetical protein
MPACFPALPLRSRCCGYGGHDGNIYLASGAAHNLNPANYPGLNIVSLDDPSVIKQLPYEMRLPFHAEQKLLNYAKANNIDVAAIYTHLPACSNGWRRKKFLMQ